MMVRSVPGVMLLVLVLLRGTGSLYARHPVEEIERREALMAEAFRAAVQGDLKRALPLFEELYKSEPNNETFLYQYALALLYYPGAGGAEKESPLRVKELRLANRLLEQCVELQEGYGGDRKALSLRHFHRGMSLWLLGDTAGARTSFQRSAALHPLGGEHFYNLYKLERRAGNSVEARAYRDSYLKIRSGS